MTTLQAVYIRGHEERSDPKPHIVYRIEVQASVRSWQMWRRYSEFTDLHTELTKSTGSAPPAPLPPKHTFSLFTRRDDAKLVEERRAGLETYLRAIVSAKEEQWRECYAFKEFLGVPVGKPAGADGGADKPHFTSASWLDEHLELQARIRDVRADVNKRDALGDRGDVAGAHTANVQGKKKLAGVLSRVGTLEKGLEELAAGGMAEGELRRRTDMAARLRDDCEKLAKIVTVARNTSSSARSGVGASYERDPAPETDRQSLLGTGPAFGTKPVARVFGKPKPEESEETRPLDDQGLMQLQEQKMANQDASLAQLSTILGRQKQLGLAIGHEISEHIEILDSLSNDVDRTADKLGKAKKQMNRLG
jgi:regulator of vacuolar morphogenesis